MIREKLPDTQKMVGEDVPIGPCTCCKRRCAKLVLRTRRVVSTFQRSVRTEKAVSSSTAARSKKRKYICTHERRWLLVDPLREDFQHARRDVPAREGQPL